MSRYAVARLDEIDEISDGRCPSRPIRHHFGITSFGVNAWTGREAGDRIINEHDEGQDDGDEELYLVQRGRARFELDGEPVQAPVGTLVYVPPDVRRTAFAEEAGTTIIALGGTPGKAYEPSGFEVWAPLGPLYNAGEYAEAADRSRLTPSTTGCFTTSRAARVLPDERPTRSSTSGSPPSVRVAAPHSPPRTPTSIRYATTPRSRN